MTIIGVMKAGTVETELEAQINNRVDTFVVDSPVLGGELGISTGADFETRLLEKVPFSVETQIQGTKITQLTASQQ